MGDVEAKGAPNNRVQMIIPPQRNVDKKLLDRTE
jgi:hypothetical protein